jgi:hypothetical protein
MTVRLSRWRRYPTTGVVAWYGSCFLCSVSEPWPPGLPPCRLRHGGPPDTPRPTTHGGQGATRSDLPTDGEGLRQNIDVRTIIDLTKLELIITAQPIE